MSIPREKVPGTLYGMSPNGWIDQELFCHWLKDLFLTYIPPQQTSPIYYSSMAILLTLPHMLLN